MASSRYQQDEHPFLVFLLMSLCGGLVLSCLAVPGLAVTMGATNLAAQNMQNLPQDLVAPPQSEGSTVYMADGSVLATFYDQNRTYVPLSEIAPVMQQAQVAIEDRRFFQHGAVDMQGMVRAVFIKVLGGQQQGASTLTQQYVKMVREQIALNNHDMAEYYAVQDDSLSRKITEMRYAIALERQLSKNQILERYLNLAYYGDGCYGVEAAAMYYYGVHAKDLTLPQAAMLAGLVQNPSSTDPVNHTSAALSRRSAVLDAMVENGNISAAQAAEANKAGYDPKKAVKQDNGCAGSRFPFLCTYVYNTLVSDQMPGLGATIQDRMNELDTGGLQIQTVIDPKVQEAVQAGLSSKLAPTDQVLGVVAEVQPGTGNIVAMAQSRPYGNDQAAGQTNYNYAVNAYPNASITGYSGGASGFQAGSTFKLFTLATALGQGAPLNTIYPGPSTISVKGWPIQSCTGTFAFPDTYTPKNVYNQSYGEINMVTATINSVNTYFMQLERDAGQCNVVKTAQSMGMVAAYAAPKNEGGDQSTDLITGWLADRKPSFTLGTIEISPLNVAEAYATVAAGGIHCNAVILKSVTANDGSSIPVPSANCQQVMDPRVASNIDYAMVQTGQNGSVAGFRVPGGYPQAMKTGTTDQQQTEWVAGYTPELATAAMVWADQFSPLGTKGATLYNQRGRTSGTYFNGSSGHDAGQIWQPTMTAG
ncbi:MAG: penicillin-binding protein, partial [Propionibacteriaceae bacterium]|nr:penicillin-binding protein [Propionibacteriaceae bacterium]